MSDRPSLTQDGRLLILVAAFLGWLCAGLHLATTSLAMRSSTIDLLGRSGRLDRDAYTSGVQREKQAKKSGDPLSEDDTAILKRSEQEIQGWFAWYTCAFLFGAAAGGWFFGWVGDRLGRVRGMGLSILAYSVFAGLASFSVWPEMLLVLWFLACMGVGGSWPNGVALVSEAWADLSRPVIAGIIGSSANIAIFALSTAATYIQVTPDDWRWVPQVAAMPVVLGVFVLFAVPESPLWLATRGKKTVRSDPQVFRMPLLPITILGITLATVPMLGGWGSANWMVPWAERAGDPSLKAYVQQCRSLPGIVGSALGGAIAAFVGRRLCYCLVSLAALFCAQWTFWLLTPTDETFLIWVAALGFFSGIYFGWLPLFLPELFPTAVRSTGGGVSFNFGRILTAVTVFMTGTLTVLFGGDYASIGRVTSLVFLIGAAVVWLAPDTTRRALDE